MDCVNGILTIAFTGKMLYQFHNNCTRRTAALGWKHQDGSMTVMHSSWQHCHSYTVMLMSPFPYCHQHIPHSSIKWVHLEAILLLLPLQLCHSNAAITITREKSIAAFKTPPFLCFHSHSAIIIVPLQNSQPHVTTIMLNQKIFLNNTPPAFTFLSKHI